MRVRSAILPCTAIAAMLFSCLASCCAGAEEEGERYALLVGVSTYRSDSGFTALKYPESDMKRLAESLKEIGFQERNIRLMVQSAPDERFNPRRENILKELSLLMANKRPNDTVMVVLSGHGLQKRGTDNSYFCPNDTNLKNIDTWLDMETVFAQMKLCNAGGKLLIADCCRDDPSLNNLKGVSEKVESMTRPAKLKPPQNVAVLLSCGTGESAYEEEELKGGVFTYFLIEGLKGDASMNGVIEVKSLASYLQRKVYDYVSGKRGASQTPSFRMESDKPLVLANLRKDLALTFPAKMKAAREATAKQDYAHAVEMFQAAQRLKPDDPSVRTELADALTERGKDYHSGRGVEKDYKEAMRWYKLAVAQGSSRAENNIGMLYQFGFGVMKDEKEAARWVRIAADKGLAIAQKNLGCFYREGTGVAQDDAEAVRWFRLAASQGQAESITSMGYMCEQGRGVDKDDKEAVRWYRAGAAANEVYAMRNLALMCKEGRGVLQNDEEAVLWFRKAADLGFDKAQTDLGRMYSAGRGVPQDNKEAVRWYRKAADQGESWAQNSLGYMYEAGQGVEKNEVEAARWYRLSADQGNGTGQSNLGNLYLNGTGVEQDYKEAARWFRKAAAQRDATAQCNLGYMYESGKGMAPDETEAARWYRLAAEQGLAMAQNNLGIYYKDGKGVVQNDNEAVKWFKKAADQGNPSAQNYMGVMYQAGRGGLPRNIGMAVEWYRKAAKNGEEWGAKNLHDLGYRN